MFLSGAVLVEVVFAWPGLGRLLLSSLLSRDYPVLLGMFLVISVGVILANLITDLAYARLDPRIRYQ
jgi:peptide/nickel transport system permease protein